MTVKIKLRKVNVCKQYFFLLEEDSWMNANRMSLLNSLFSIINENNESDSDYILAHYFLDHYHELDQLNIYEVAEECFVSRSSVRRFCKSIGFENFLTLKNEFSMYDDKFQAHMEFAERDNFRKSLTEEINEMIKELDWRMDTREVYNIAKQIHDSRRTIFLTTGGPAGIVREFQQSMIFNKKVIYLISELYSDNELLLNLNEDDFLITISNSGIFAYASYPLIAESNAQKTLITLRRDPIFNKWYDKVYHLSSEDKSKNGVNVYGKYGVSYMLDVIYSEYTKNFK